MDHIPGLLIQDLEFRDMNTLEMSFSHSCPLGLQSDLTVKSNLHEGSAFFLNAFGFSRLDLENPLLESR